ncbi:MAG: YraN family protein [Treponema sp.]|jgi:putative endonuclease|nr:YraN family protein [Treponema sp.]
MNSAAVGKKGESQAAAALENAGMDIIAKNIRSKFGEVDIVAVEGETIVFAEVKTWSAYGMEDLQYGVNLKKQHKIIKTAKYFLSENRKYSNMTIRFDVVFVKKNPHCESCEVTHLASAFEESV